MSRAWSGPRQAQALSEELLGHAGGRPGGTDALENSETVRQAPCRRTPNLFFHRTRLRCFAEQLTTLETVCQKLSGLCAPHTDLESRPKAVRRTARAQDPQRDSRHVEQVLRTGRRAEGLRLRAYDRFASGLRRLPGRPDEGGLSAMFLIGRDYALAPVARDRVRGLGPLHRPHVESGTPPGHDKEPSRASERAARPLKTGLVRR